ncbi:MAG: protein translocase subunit SecD, partial [Gammaproteobacteria bacterium]|nr:protein translocase subunit SecD [Gammaproteobacteria bacterium]
MMNQYPLWKYLLLVLLILFGSIFALPNLYGEDPSVLITKRTTGIDDATKDRITDLLKQSSISYKTLEHNDGKVLIRLASADDQLAAVDRIKALELFKNNRNYTIALNLAPATPGWLQSLGAAPMYLGLDLRGGVHFLMEVDMDSAIKRLENILMSDMRSHLRSEKIRYLGITRNSNGINIKFRDADNMDKGQSALKREFKDLDYITDEEAMTVTAKLTEVAIRNEKRSAIQQNVTTLRNRVNELGVAEPVIQQQGDSRIVVQLPGVQDTARAKEILG